MQVSVAVAALIGTIGAATNASAQGFLSEAPKPAREVAEPMVMVLPPFGLLSGGRSAQVVVPFFVSPGGTVDSTAVTGLPDSHDRATLQQVMQRYRFRPALRGRCAVASTTSITMTL